MAEKSEGACDTGKHKTVFFVNQDEDEVLIVKNLIHRPAMSLAGFAALMMSPLPKPMFGGSLPNELAKPLPGTVGRHAKIGSGKRRRRRERGRRKADRQP